MRRWNAKPQALTRDTETAAHDKEVMFHYLGSTFRRLTAGWPLQHPSAPAH